MVQFVYILLRNENWRSESIIENRISNQSTWVVGFPIVIVFQRVTGAPINGAIREILPFQLIRVKRLNVSSVVLVEIR